MDLLAPVLRPVADLSTATATYRAMNGAWPATLTDLEGFATANHLPLETAAFKTVLFEPVDAHSAMVRFELNSAGNARLLVPEAKGQIRLSYPTPLPNHSSHSQ